MMGYVVHAHSIIPLEQGPATMGPLYPGHKTSEGFANSAVRKSNCSDQVLALTHLRSELSCSRPLLKPVADHCPEERIAL